MKCHPKINQTEFNLQINLRKFAHKKGGLSLNYLRGSSYLWFTNKIARKFGG